MSFHILIPARMNSDRLPKKSLADIHGKPMIEHVWRRSSMSSAKSVTIATDSKEIFSAARNFGAKVIQTAACSSGTDRIYQASQNMEFQPEDIIVNVQGDEPLIPTEIIEKVAQLAIEKQGIINTLCADFCLDEDRSSTHLVKTLFNENNRALYFGREDRAGAYKHIGIYAYSYANLEYFCHLAVSYQEKKHRLEQLRIKDLQDIVIDKINFPVPHGVDTMEDLERVRSLICNR